MGVSGCDQEIDPFQSTEMAYSIYGHLDAHADTQWIRVAPFRTSIASTPDPVDATVTIEELGTGRIIEMIPALFSEGSENFGDTLFAYNFWTVEPFEYLETYRLTARRSDGSVASSVVQIPADHSHLPVVVGVAQPNFRNPPDYVRYHLLPEAYPAMVHTRSHSTRNPECRESEYNYLPPRPLEFVGGEYQVNVRAPSIGYCEPDTLFVVDSIDLVRSWEEWPFGASNDYSNVLAHNNIENGIGYLGGLTVVSLPLERCDFVGPGAPAYCELYYAPNSATLFVRPINVSGFPEEYRVDPEVYVFSPTVRLRRGNESWTRLPASSAATPDPKAPGISRFPGLLPGQYQVRVEGIVDRRDFITDEQRLYCEERILEIVPGETSIDILMTWPEADPDEAVNENGCREG